MALANAFQGGLHAHGWPCWNGVATGSIELIIFIYALGEPLFNIYCIYVHYTITCVLVQKCVRRQANPCSPRADLAYARRGPDFFRKGFAHCSLPCAPSTVVPAHLSHFAAKRTCAQTYGTERHNSTSSACGPFWGC